MAISEKTKIEIFCCYAREDQKLLLEFIKHLRPLERLNLIEVWSDIDIQGGEKWEREIENHLDSAQIILLLISSDFMDSDYCYSKEMKRALERHERGEARVIPIILRPVDWEITPLGELQALPKNALPIMSGGWHSVDDAFYDAFKGLKLIIEDLQRKSVQVELVETITSLESDSARKEPEILDSSSLSPRPVDLPSAESPSDLSQRNGLSKDELGFRISPYLVTNREFKEFLDENSGWQVGENFQHTGEVDDNYLRHWEKRRTEYPRDKADHPVVYVSRNAAEAYMAWRGRKPNLTLRLPTEYEWKMAACAGFSSLEEALAEALDPAQLAVNFNKKVGGDTTSVGYMGYNRYDLSDLFGNVYELCICGNDTRGWGGSFESPREQLMHSTKLLGRDQCRGDLGFRYAYSLSNKQGETDA